MTVCSNYAKNYASIIYKGLRPALDKETDVRDKTNDLRSDNRELVSPIND